MMHQVFDRNFCVCPLARGGYYSGHELPSVVLRCNIAPLCLTDSHYTAKHRAIETLQQHVLPNFSKSVSCLVCLGVGAGAFAIGISPVGITIHEELVFREWVWIKSEC